MKRNWKWMMMLGSVLAVTGVVAADGEESKGPAVTIAPVSELTQSEPKRYVGVVSAEEEVSIPARISGRIEKINFEQGSMVKKGDLLFELEDTTYQAEALAARAVLQQTQAESTYARKEFERKSGLFGKKAIAETELDNATRLVEFTEAKMREAEAAVMRTENELSYTRIYAPITGRIGRANYTVGNYVTPATPEALTDIVQMDPINVSFSVSERDYLDRFCGPAQADSLITVVPANGEAYTGKITVDFINNRVDKSTGTVTIWLECENPDARLMPDGFVTVNVAEKYAAPVIAASVTAILTDDKTSYVYVVNDKNVVERRDVVLGDSVGSLQGIRSGVKAGERVIVEGVHKAMPGMTVSPKLAQPGR